MSEAKSTADKWQIVRDEEGVPHTQCPSCGAQDQIQEIDVAVRLNTLHLDSEDGMTATASCSDGDWEHEGYQCGACYRTELEAPDGFEILEWY